MAPKATAIFPPSTTRAKRRHASTTPPAAKTPPAKASGIDEISRAHEEAQRQDRGRSEGARDCQGEAGCAEARTAHIGSTPATRYRGDPAIFGRLVEDHDRASRTVAIIGDTEGKSPDRAQALP